MQSQFWESQPHLPSSGYTLSVSHCYAGWKPSRRPEAGAKVICKCICEGVCVCVRDRKTGLVCSHLAVCQKARYFVVVFFFSGWILNLVFTRWKWFSLQTSHLLCPSLQRNETSGLFEFLAKRKSVMNRSFGNICGHNHYLPSSSLALLHQQTLAQHFHSSRS